MRLARGKKKKKKWEEKRLKHLISCIPAFNWHQICNITVGERNKLSNVYICFGPLTPMLNVDLRCSSGIFKLRFIY